MWPERVMLFRDLGLLSVTRRMEGWGKVMMIVDGVGGGGVVSLGVGGEV